MRAHVFTEGSNTTVEDQTKPAKEYFQGLFRMVAGLTDELPEPVDTTLHILSEEFGVLRGDQPIADATRLRKDGSDYPSKSVQEEFLIAAREADVMIILLSADTFQNTVVEIWPELVEGAKKGSLWCIGAARTSFDLIDIEKLRKKDCSVISYYRVGVARIGTDAREELIEAVDQKASE